MDQETKQRTATDVLLSLESKINQLMQMYQNLNFNITILSNKLTNMISMEASDMTNPYTIATAGPSFQNLSSEEGFKVKVQDELTLREDHQVPKDMGLSSDTSPVGFRRTSRPETYAGQPSNGPSIPTPSVPQPPMHAPKLAPSNTQHIPSAVNRIPIIQRIVDKNGKSLFMAQVEITNEKTNIVETKTRTNGTGKYQATLLPGDYRVVIRRNDGNNKQSETTQKITINSNSPNELPVLIIK